MFSREFSEYVTSEVSDHGGVKNFFCIFYCHCRIPMFFRWVSLLVLRSSWP